MAKQSVESKIKSLIKEDIKKLEETRKELKETINMSMYQYYCDVSDPSDQSVTTKKVRNNIKRVNRLNQTIEIKSEMLDWDVLNLINKKSKKK